jgi:putative spermidine/putrescine transport system substrate-binding protein
MSAAGPERSTAAIVSVSDSRRRFLRGLFAVGVAGSTLGVLAACTGPSAAPPASTGATTAPAKVAAPSTSNVELVHATWTTHPGTIQPAIDQFTKETGIAVKFAVGTTGDRLTKLYAEKGNPSIDAAVVPPDDALKLLQADVIEPPDMTIPNAKDLVEAARHPAGYVASLFATGLAYNPAQGKPTSWLDLWDPKYKGKVGLSAWPGSPATVQLVMAARLHGGSDDNLGPGFEALKRLLPVKFLATGPAAEPFYAQGDIWISPAIHGAVIVMKKKGVPIDWIAPKEGAVADFNILVIPKGVKDKAAVMKFADYFIGPAVQQAYARDLFYAPVNKNVQIPADLAPDIHPTVEEQKNLQAIPWEKIMAQQSALTDRWNREILGQ